MPRLSFGGGDSNRERPSWDLVLAKLESLDLKTTRALLSSSSRHAAGCTCLSPHLTVPAHRQTLPNPEPQQSRSASLKGYSDDTPLLINGDGEFHKDHGYDVDDENNMDREYELSEKDIKNQSMQPSAAHHRRIGYATPEQMDSSPQSTSTVSSRLHKQMKSPVLRSQYVLHSLDKQKSPRNQKKRPGKITQGEPSSSCTPSTPSTFGNAPLSRDDKDEESSSPSPVSGTPPRGSLYRQGYNFSTHNLTKKFPPPRSAPSEDSSSDPESTENTSILESDLMSLPEDEEAEIGVAQVVQIPNDSRINPGFDIGTA